MIADEEKLFEFIRSEFFSNRVNELLEERQMTRTNLAFRLGITPAALTIMLGRNNPKLFTMIQVARALDIHLFELLEGYEDYVI